MIKHGLIHKIYNEIYPTNHLCLVSVFGSVVASAF